MKRLILVLLLTAKAHASYILAPGGGGGGGVSIGGAVSGGGDKSVLFVSPAGVLAQDPNFTYDTATSTFSVPTTIGNLTGNADTATALAANPTDCPPGEYAVAIDTQANLTCAPEAGAGTVTSVGLALPAEFSVSGSPVTSSGTLTGSWASAAQNSVFAGPSSSSGTPTFRSLVVGDLPTVTTAKGGTGLTATPTNGQIPIGNGAGYSLSTITGTANQVGVSNASGSITLSTPQDLDTNASVEFSVGLFKDSFAVGDGSGGTEYVGLAAPVGLASSYGFILPPDMGVSGQVLGTDGSETSWVSVLANPMDSDGDMIVGGSGGVATKLDAGTSGQVLESAGAASPVWSSRRGYPGEIFAFGGSTCPTGALAADGTAISRSTYSDLFTAISTTWGAGDGSTTFNKPDLRNVFPRGANGSTRTISGIVQPAVTLGATVNDQFQGHLHSVDPPSTSTSSDGTHQHRQLLTNGVAGATNFADRFASTGENNYGSSLTDNAGAHTHTVNISAFDSASPKTDGSNGTPRTGSTTFPVNAGVLYCVIY